MPQRELEYVAFYPEDFLVGCLELEPQYRSIYAICLIIQASKGKVASAQMVSEFTGEPVEVVESVFAAKFVFDKDLGGYVNLRMAEERAKSVKKLSNKREGAAKARARKEKVPPHTPLPKEIERERDSDIKLDTKLDIKKSPSVWELTQKIEKGEKHLEELRAQLDRTSGKERRAPIRTEVQDLKAKLQGWRRTLTNS